MYFRQRIRRLSHGASLGHDAALPTRGVDQYPPIRPPKLTMSTRGGLLFPERIRSPNSELNATTASQTSSAPTSQRMAPSPSTFISSQAASEITSISAEEEDTSSSAIPQSQIDSLPTSVVTPSYSNQSASLKSWTSLGGFLRVLNQCAGAFGPLKAVVDELVSCVSVYERMSNGRGEFKKLQNELEGIFQELQQYYRGDVPPAVTASIESLCRSILRELAHVKARQVRDPKKQYFTTEEDSEDILACYRRVRGHLQRLTLNANLSIWKNTDELTTSARLDRLCPSLSACYNSNQAVELKRGECTPGTRVDVLAQAHSWVYNPSAGSVYWLNGMAGTGKTTIAYTLCAELGLAHNLGASFFCSRSLPECRDVNRIVPSIAYQLAQFSQPFRCALSRVLELERDVHTQLLSIQFEKLVVRPTLEVRDTLPEDMVVVIDALDECDSKKSTRQILEALLTKTVDLPLKFFIASRPEPEIRDQMKKQAGRRAISRLVLHELEKGMVQSDIETYLRVSLQVISPSESEIAALVDRAGILFIYAATVVRYIGYDNFRKSPRKRLRNVLGASSVKGSNPYKEIDDLYGLILQAAFDDPCLDDEEKRDTREVLYTTLCAHEPPTTSSLSGLLGLHDEERVYAALASLWSVLHVVESSGLVTTLHASFPDYMFDPARSKQYHCDPAAYDHALVQYCFDCIKDTKPQFNICGLESSYMLDDEIPDLNTKVEKTIDAETIYACLYWEAHLARAKGSSDVIERINIFLSSNLLLWLEVMNLTKRIHTGVEMMRRAEEWCRYQSCPDDLSQLIHDASRFVTAFASTPVSQSTPHIYLSLLAFQPEYSIIAKLYAIRLKEAIPQGTAIARQSLALMATWPVSGQVTLVLCSPNNEQLVFIGSGQIYLLDPITGQVTLATFNRIAHTVTSIGFSSDGTRLISGYSDGRIRVWNPLTGKKELGPLKGHTGRINAVTFSPDGTRIISGSDDHTVRKWDASTGRRIFSPLKGHTGPVTSVAFSPDGTRIVSGSTDRTLRVWDALGGRLILGPLTGHSDSVTSVIFSPDGASVVSGSYDATIRIWDTKSGKMVIDPLEDDCGGVTSVGVSHDGARILSGSSDRTLRVWDEQSGQLLLGPLEGHVGLVTSVAFSSDSSRLISGSYDGTIRMWDAQSGSNILGSLRGHTGVVNSVAFSADGARIATGSDDHTVRVWDAYNKRQLLRPLEGHTDRVRSVAFSPSGALIVSGSNDRTIRVWDARNGKMMLSPLQGHTDSVLCVAVSPCSAYIISGSRDRTICMWNARSGKQMHRMFQGHTGSVLTVAYSPNGINVVSGSTDSAICIWDVRDGKLVFGPLKEHTNWVRSVCFSSDGTRIVSGSSDDTLLVWDAQDGQTVLGPLLGHTDSVTAVSFSGDGSLILSGSRDKTVRVWDAASGQVALGPLEGHTESVTSVAFSFDGTSIISASEDRTVIMWDAQNSQAALGPPEGHTDWVRSVAFSLDGVCIASGSNDNSIRMWDARSGQPVLVQFYGHTEPVLSLAFSPDSTRLVSGSDDRTIRVWDVRTGTTILGPLTRHTDSVRSVAFSPDGTRIVSGSSDDAICLWDAVSGELLLNPLKGHTDQVRAIAFSPDGNCIVSGSDDETLRIWDVQSGQTLLDPLTGHTDWVTSVSYSPDNTRIASGSGDDSICLWEAQSGRLILGPLEGHTDLVTSIAFSPNSRFIVSGSKDRTIRVWDVQSGQTVLGPLEGHTGSVRSVAFSPDGSCIASGSNDRAIIMWDARTEGAMAQSFGPPSWKITNDGWVVDRDDESKHLVWVPSDLRPLLLHPRVLFLISKNDVYTSLRFDGACIGESWARCYEPDLY